MDEQSKPIRVAGEGESQSRSERNTRMSQNSTLTAAPCIMHSVTPHCMHSESVDLKGIMGRVDE